VQKRINVVYDRRMMDEHKWLLVANLGTS